MLNSQFSDLYRYNKMDDTSIVKYLRLCHTSGHLGDNLNLRMYDGLQSESRSMSRSRILFTVIASVLLFSAIGLISPFYPKEAFAATITSSSSSFYGPALERFLIEDGSKVL